MCLQLFEEDNVHGEVRELFKESFKIDVIGVELRLKVNKDEVRALQISKNREFSGRLRIFNHIAITVTQGTYEY